jgi:hypothetical protein
MLDSLSSSFLTNWSVPPYGETSNQIVRQTKKSQLSLIQVNIETPDKYRYVYVIWMWIDWYRKYQPAAYPEIDGTFLINIHHI